MNEEKKPSGATGYYCLPAGQAAKITSSPFAVKDDGVAGEGRTQGYEMTGSCQVGAVSDGLMRMLQDSMRFDRRTLRRLFHAVTHGRQVRLDVAAEFSSGTVVHCVVTVRTPRSLRLLLRRIHHIRTPYRIVDREDRQ